MECGRTPTDPRNPPNGMRWPVHGATRIARRMLNGLSSGAFEGPVIP